MIVSRLNPMLMNPYSFAVQFGTACLLAASPPLSAQVFYPKQNLADTSTGYLQSTVDGYDYRGSGVITRDPRLIYSCAHLFYENGMWATHYNFHRAYHSEFSPSSSDGQAPRGIQYFTTYGNNTDSFGSNSSRAFAYDFTVLYGPDSFGDPVGWWSDGGERLRSTDLKRIVGYPKTIEYTGARGFAYQHSTDYFGRSAFTVTGAFLDFNNVSTGSGNSGGPVFVRDGDTQDDYLAGILVSGSYSTAGAYALNADSNNLASAALGLPKITNTFSNTTPVQIPDARFAYTTREVIVSGFDDSLTDLLLNLSISTTSRGDLDVYMISPSGRIRWINKRSANTSNNLIKNNANYTTTYRGDVANGRWRLKMRDTVALDRARFNSFGVVVSGYAP